MAKRTEVTENEIAERSALPYEENLPLLREDAQAVAIEQGQPVHLYRVSMPDGRIVHGYIVDSVVAKLAKGLPAGASLLKRVNAYYTHVPPSGIKPFFGTLTAVVATLTPPKMAIKATKTQPVLIAAKTTKTTGGKKK